MIFLTDLKKAEEYIFSHKDDIINDLFTLCRIPSVQGEPEPDAPFGAEPKNALIAAEKLFSEAGCTTALHPAYLVSGFGNGEKTIGIFSHADVVPADGDWKKTEPFSPVMLGDWAVGRGVEDNKSGIVASLWAVRAFSACNIPLKNKLLLFTGSNEENNMGDMAYFLENEKVPDVSIVPDNDFPVCCGEKGIMHFDAVSLKKVADVLSLSAGTAYNIVPDFASAELANGSSPVTAKGVSRHAAYPDGAINALHLLLEKLISLCPNDSELFDNASKISSGFHGEALGIASSDEVFGALSCVCSLGKITDGRLSLGFDVRYGSTYTGAELEALIRESLSKFGFALENAEYSDGVYNGTDSVYAKAMLKAYRRATGEEDAEGYISSGGTYARRLRNAFSIGTAKMSVPLPDDLGSAHCRDEALHIPSFLEGIMILMHMIKELDDIL